MICESHPSDSDDYFDCTSEIQEVTGTMWIIVAVVLAAVFVAGAALGWLIGFTMGRVG
ncbi:MAG: hypothetical protein KDI37_09610 [Xanthomonadales bacterium]|nr:hypothetical protein [Xanthomonadales bacterium]